MAVISTGVGRALRIGERLRTGMLHINDQTVNDEVMTPFGGFGPSMNGHQHRWFGESGGVHPVAVGGSQERGPAVSILIDEVRTSVQVAAVAVQLV